MKMESKPPITQGLQHIPTEPPAWAQTAGRAIHHLMNDFGGGRRCLKLAWVINFQKLATIPLLSIFMFKYKTSALRPGFMPQCRAVTDWYGSLRSSPFPIPVFKGLLRLEQESQPSSAYWAGTGYSAGC